MDQTNYQIIQHDEFSIYTTKEEIINFVDTLLENGLTNEIEIYERCIEKFGIYFSENLNLFFS